MSEFTPEQVERAAEALWNFEVGGSREWADLSEWAKQFYRADGFAVLSAAGAPEKVAPVVDEAKLFGVITDAVFHASNLEDAGTVIPYMSALARSKLAAAVGAYLRGESK